MAKIAELCAASEHDQTYQEQYKALMRQIMCGNDSPEILARMDALIAEFTPHANEILPTPGSEDWSWIVDYVSELPKEKRKFEAKMWACFILNNLAWFNDAARKEYLDWLWASSDSYDGYGATVARLFSLAKSGNINSLDTRPSVETLRKWFEDFDAPRYEDIDLSKEWFTAAEYAAISRHAVFAQHKDARGLPLTTDGWRNLISRKVRRSPSLSRKRKRLFRA